MALGLLATLPARADEASGRWSGRAELRTTSFREANTSLIAPTIGLRLDAPSATTLRGYYLVDAISSASVSVDVVTGASVTIDPNERSTFRELRQEGGVGVEQRFAVGEQELSLGASVHTSHERDYHAYSGTVSASLALDERNWLLGLAATYVHDEVRYVEHRLDPMTSQATTSIRELPGVSDFDGIVVAASLERLLSRRAVLGAGYDLGYMSGYLGNPYRLVLVDSLLSRESIPSTRWRHAPWVHVRVALPRARAAAHLTVRGYADDFDIRAFAAEARWYQALGRHALLRVRYRGFKQSAAYFDSGFAVLIPNFPDGTRHATSNPRYAAMSSHEVGLAFTTDLGAFGGRRAPWLSDVELEFAMDYRLADNRFGDALFGSFVVRVPIP